MIFFLCYIMKNLQKNLNIILQCPPFCLTTGDVFLQQIFSDTPISINFEKIKPSLYEWGFKLCIKDAIDFEARFAGVVNNLRCFLQQWNQIYQIGSVSSGSIIPKRSHLCNFSVFFFPELLEPPLFFRTPSVSCFCRQAEIS